MEFTFEPTLDDYTALFRHILRTPESEYRKLAFIKAVSGALFLPGGYIIGRVISHENLSLAYLTGEALIVLTATICWGWYLYRSFPRKLAILGLKKKPDILDHHTIYISQEGIDIKNTNTHVLTYWRDLYHVIITPEYIFVGQEYVIPRRALGDELFTKAADEIRTHLKGRHTDVFDLW